MNKHDAERAIIANRPGEPFVLVERVDGEEIVDLSALEWQAPTDPPTWDEVVAWHSASSSAAARVLAGTNKAVILHQRNRWLTETDPYMLPAPSFPTDMPQALVDAITAHLALLQTWRAQLRDYPSTVTDWTSPPPLPSPPAIQLATGGTLVLVS